MATKSQIELLIDTTEHLVNKCDQQAVKLIPGRIQIFHSATDKEITNNDYRELINRVRVLSEKFSSNCGCTGI